MADAQKTIDLIFNGIDKTGAATMAALGNASKFTGSLQNATQPIADFTLGAVKLEAGLLAAGLAMTVFATKTAGDFEQSFAQISTLFDASDKDLAKFKDDIKDYAAASGVSMEDITKSLAAAIGAGVDYTDSLGLMAVAEKLSVATKGDMQATTEVLVGTMNAYGIATKDAGALADLMFQIVKDGKIEMNDLAASLANVTPIAAAAGIGMKEVGAAIAVLTASGMAPSTAIDALKSAISNIIKPSEQATKLAGELGIEFNAAALKSKGLEGVLKDVAKATGGSADKMALLFGDVTGLASVLTLTGPQAKKFGETIESMGNSAGSVATAYAKMAGGMDVSLQKVTNAFTGLMLAIGTPLLDEFGGIATAIANIFTALSASVKDGGMKDLVSYIEGVFKDIQSSLETVAKNLPAALASADFSGFKGGIDAVITAMKSLFGSIDLTTVDGLKTAIETVGAAFLGLSKYTAGVIEAFEPLFTLLVDVGKGAKDADLSFLEFAGNIGGIATQLNVVLPLFTALLGLLTVKSGLGLISEFKGLVTILPTLATALTGAGVALTTYFAADKVIDLVKALAQWKDANGKLTQSQEDATAINAKAGLSLDGFAKSTGIAAKSIDEALALVKDGTVVWDAASSSYKKAGDAMAGAGTAASTAQADFRKSEITLQNSAAASEKAADATGKLGIAQKDLSTYTLKTVPIIDSLTGKVIGYEQQLVKAEGGTVKLGKASDATGKDLAKVAKETEKAKDATEKWNQEVAKMAFQEKLKLIESQSKIMTATIEADAKKTVAAFESIAKGIESTGDVLASLFGNMKDFGKLSYFEQNKVSKQIDKENDHRDKAFKLQKELTEAQIRQMNAQTDALMKGDGLIKIDGAGLKPHLEAFMWEILKAIQVKVNKDGLKLLLGT